MIRRQDPVKGERSTETSDRERGAPLVAMSSCRHNDTPAEGFPFAARRNPRRGKTACDTGSRLWAGMLPWLSRDSLPDQGTSEI